MNSSRATNLLHSSMVFLLRKVKYYWKLAKFLRLQIFGTLMIEFYTPDVCRWSYVPDLSYGFFSIFEDGVKLDLNSSFLKQIRELWGWLLGDKILLWTKLSLFRSKDLLKYLSDGLLISLTMKHCFVWTYVAKMGLSAAFFVTFALQFLSHER